MADYDYSEGEPITAYGNEIGQLRYDRPWEIGEAWVTKTYDIHGMEIELEP